METKNVIYPLKPSLRWWSILLELIVMLCVLLFLYAAVNKLMDVQKFRVQIGQSPLLTPIAGFTAWAVPLLEIALALLLLFHKTRLLGLYGFFGMMVLFSAYIVVLV